MKEGKFLFDNFNEEVVSGSRRLARTIALRPVVTQVNELAEYNEDKRKLFKRCVWYACQRLFHASKLLESFYFEADWLRGHGLIIPLCVGDK